MTTTSRKRLAKPSPEPHRVGPIKWARALLALRKIAMQGNLAEKFLSRAFLLTVATAVAAWCDGRSQEAIYLVIAYVLGDRAVSTAQSLRKP